MKKAIAKIEQGLFDLIKDTQDGGNEQLIARSKVLNLTEALITNLKLHTQRRLTSKLNPNQGAKVEELFKRFSTAIGAIK
jgi:hypothetical protein